MRKTDCCDAAGGGYCSCSRSGPCGSYWCDRLNRINWVNRRDWFYGRHRIYREYRSDGVYRSNRIHWIYRDDRRYGFNGFDWCHGFYRRYRC